MPADDSAAPVLHERRGPVAHVTMNRPRYRNARNSAMTYALDDAFYRAADDPEVKVVVLAGAGEDFSAGHDIGTPGRDAPLPFERRAGLWWDHSTRSGAKSRFARESEVHLGMCRRRRETVFGLHHLAHSHNAGTAADSLGGMNVAAMKEANG